VKRRHVQAIHTAKRTRSAASLGSHAIILVTNDLRRRNSCLEETSWPTRPNCLELWLSQATCIANAVMTATARSLRVFTTARKVSA